MQTCLYTQVIVPPPPGVPLLPSAANLRLLTLTEEEEEGENDENSTSDSSLRGGRMFQYDPSYYESREEAFARGKDGRVWHLEEEEEEKVNIDEKTEFEMGKTVLQLQEKQQNGNYSSESESEEEWEYFDEAAEARAEEDRTKLIKVLKMWEMMIV